MIKVKLMQFKDARYKATKITSSQFTFNAILPFIKP